MATIAEQLAEYTDQQLEMEALYQYAKFLRRQASSAVFKLDARRDFNLLANKCFSILDLRGYIRSDNA